MRPSGASALAADGESVALDELNLSTGGRVEVDGETYSGVSVATMIRSTSSA